MSNRILELEKLNKQLKPIPEDLPGKFFPDGFPKQFYFIFLGPRPSMNMPDDWDGTSNYNFDAGTSNDIFFKEILTGCEVVGNYVTDIVKKRDVAGKKLSKDEVQEYLPFLLEEIEIIKPKAIILMGLEARRVFWEYDIKHQISREIEVDWVWHYSQQGAKTRREVFDRFKEVINEIRGNEQNLR